MSGVSGTGRRGLGFVLAGLMLALTLAALDQNIVATALPRITGDLGGLQHLSWVVTGFVLASTVSAPLYGRLSDLYGRKPAFTVSIGIFLLGSVLCGLAGGMIQLIAFRALQGLGAGGLIVLAQTVVGDLVSPRERGRYQGLFAAVFAACSVAGPLLGGFITQYASWRWIFYVNLPVGGAALALIMAGLGPQPKRPAARLDLAGAGLLVAGTTCLLLVLSWGGAVYAWVSTPILALAAGAVLAFGLMVPVERRAAQPILPPDLFRNPVFLIGALVISLAAMALFAAAVFLPLMFQLLMGASPARAGLMVAPMMGGVIVASIGGGRVVSRTGRYKMLPVIGLLAAACSYAALALATLAGTGAAPIEAVLVIMGLGLGLVMPNVTTAIQNAVQAGELGGATATAAFFRSLGGALGVALSGAVLSAHLAALPDAVRPDGAGVGAILAMTQDRREAVFAAYRAGLTGAFEAGAGIALLGFLAVLFLPELPLRSQAFAAAAAKAGAEIGQTGD
jgi:EmrB/QacA subfamily drug resistance transporter